MELHSPGGENESMERLHGCVCVPARDGKNVSVCVRDSASVLVGSCRSVSEWIWEIKRR